MAHLNKYFEEIQKAVKFGADVDFEEGMYSKIFPEGATIEGIALTVVSKSSSTNMKLDLKSGKLSKIENEEEESLDPNFCTECGQELQ